MNLACEVLVICSIDFMTPSYTKRNGIIQYKSSIDTQLGYWDIAYAYQTIETPHKAKAMKDMVPPFTYLFCISYSHAFW